ncbi:MAG: hypothetical protein ACP5JH_03775 [Bacteroidota bacterium]
MLKPRGVNWFEVKEIRARVAEQESDGIEYQVTLANQSAKGGL